MWNPDLHIKSWALENEATFQRSEVTVRIRPIDISRTHGVSPFVIFKHPDRAKEEGIALTSLSDHAM